MAQWPPIEDAKLAARLAMSNDQFAALALKLARRIPAQEYSPAALERALGYPWARPAESFVLSRGDVEALDAGTWERIAAEPRFALIAFGSNGSPEALIRKFADLGALADDLPVAVGTLDGFAIKPSAHLAIYGALPATIILAAGAVCRAALLLVTAGQFAAIARTELNYELVRIDGGAFAPDLPLPIDASLFAWVSRHGALRPDLEFADQSAVLDHAARLALGPAANAEDLVRRTLEDYAWSVTDAQPRLATQASPFDRAAWDAFSSSRAARSS